MGSAFHARCADPEGAEARERWNRLDSDEQDEVKKWIKPTDLVLENGVVLSYETAHKELALGLAANGSYQPKGTPGNITEGTCDICWIVETPNGDKQLVEGHWIQPMMRIAYVPDIKRSEYTVADGPRSLQIVGYALAAAQKFGCDGYCPGIWAAKEGRWWWGDLYLYGRDDDVISDHWQRVKAAALNLSDEPSYGNHCQGCYGRTSCPSWLLPPELAETSLAPFTKEGMAITPDKAASLVLMMKRCDDMATTLKKLLKAHVADGNRVIDGDKEWRAVAVSGRVSFDSGRFEKERPEMYQEYSRVGPPSEQYRWCNAEPKKKGGKK